MLTRLFTGLNICFSSGDPPGRPYRIYCLYLDKTKNPVLAGTGLTAVPPYFPPILSEDTHLGTLDTDRQKLLGQSLLSLRERTAISYQKAPIIVTVDVSGQAY